MRTLLIDNYDSFTFNLFQMLAEVNRVPPIVVRNDSVSWDELRDLEYDNIVVSPGPGRPDVERDFGVSKRAILDSDVPLLGVCLGHQGICHLLGGRLDYAAEVMHGRESRVHHDHSALFEGIPSPFTAVRYHSLLVSEVPAGLARTAWTEDDLVMAVRHEERPLWGVQFHPESICTEFGQRLLRNFRSLTTQYLKAQRPRRRASVGARSGRDHASHDVVPRPESPGSADGVDSLLHGKRFRVLSRRIARKLDAERVFLDLFADSRPSFWLDTALAQGCSRFSYMGDASGPHAEYVTYDVGAREVTIEHLGRSRTRREDIFTYLNRQLRARRKMTEGLPFDFNCGYAGYLGYELKADCGGDRAHASAEPDAAFVFADRLVVFDHEEEIAYLVCVDDEDNLERARAWLDQTFARLMNVAEKTPWVRKGSARSTIHAYRHDPEEYLELIASCQAEISRGETYEVCLTNMFEQHVEVDPLNTYRALRERNPAPYAAYLNFPDVSVLSSSPERFLAIDAAGVVEAKPIKGTRRRGTTPAEDRRLFEDLRTNEKDRSENLMIVDLLRNDIGAVAEPGSVHVADIFAVESYATVHQLVSTVRGRLRPGISAIDCVRSSFPGGSMTGAPKKRTMEIIDRLEGGPRGVYSGSIGFLGLNGSADLSIVIRTIVVGRHGVTIGSGGAVLALSDPQSELNETLLKAEALVRVLSESALEGRPAARSAS